MTFGNQYEARASVLFSTMSFFKLVVACTVCGFPCKLFKENSRFSGRIKGSFEISWAALFLCLPPARVGRHIVFPLASVCVCLSVRHKIVSAL